VFFLSELCRSEVFVFNQGFLQIKFWSQIGFFSKDFFSNNSYKFISKDTGLWVRTFIFVSKTGVSGELIEFLTLNLMIMLKSQRKFSHWIKLETKEFLFLTSAVWKHSTYHKCNFSDRRLMIFSMTSVLEWIPPKSVDDTNLKVWMLSAVYYSNRQSY
jgi:hypothetical protein